MVTVRHYTTHGGIYGVSDRALRLAGGESDLGGGARDGDSDWPPV